MVIGCGGAGKSTFSRQLHKVTGIEVIHLDQYFWLPNWVELDKSEWHKKVSTLCRKERWIMDGNYGGTMDVRMNKADMVIFLDRSRWLCLFRVIKRIVTHYGKTRIDMGKGCKEKFSWEFIMYIYHYNRIRKPKILKKLSKLNFDKEIIILKTDKEIYTCLSEMKNRYTTWDT